MQKKKYTYDYPEQRELSKGLRQGDVKLIADKTGYSPGTVSLMCKGKRKMQDNVRKVIEQLVLINKQIEKIKVEQEIAE